MMRFVALLGKELRSVRANVPYTILTIVTPVMFMAIFVFVMRGDITLPVTAYPAADQSAFVEVLATNHADGSPPYFDVTPAPDTPPTGEETSRVVVVEEPTSQDGRVSGVITQYLNDVNTNSTKNFVNRLTGAVYAWSDGRLGGSAVSVVEHPTVAQDIPWSTALGLSSLGFGALFSGLLFGLLSITEEWEGRTILWLRLAPRGSVLVVLAKLCAGLVKSLAAGAVLIGFLGLFTGALPAEWAALAGGLALGYLTATALGFIIGFVSRSTLTSFLLALVVGLVLWIGGGGLGPMFVFGPTAVTLSQADPATHVIDIARQAYFGGTYDVTTGLGTLALFAAFAVAGAIAVYLARLRRPEAGMP